MPANEPAVIFQGTPSQAVAAPYYLTLAALALILFRTLHYVRYYFPHPLRTVTTELVWAALALAGLMVVLYAVKRFVRIASTVYTIDDARITSRSGIITKVISSIELYRVQDVTLVQPWWQAMLGIGTIVLFTSDTYHPRVTLVGMDNPTQLRASLNVHANDLRQQRGVREVTVGNT